MNTKTILTLSFAFCLFAMAKAQPEPGTFSITPRVGVSANKFTGDSDIELYCISQPTYDSYRECDRRFFRCSGCCRFNRSEYSEIIDSKLHTFYIGQVILPEFGFRLLGKGSDLVGVVSASPDFISVSSE